MARVHTEYGPGEIIAVDTLRGRRQYRVAGDGFEIWLDETKVAGLKSANPMVDYTDVDDPHRLHDYDDEIERLVHRVRPHHELEADDPAYYSNRRTARGVAIFPDSEPDVTDYGPSTHHHRDYDDEVNRLLHRMGPAAVDEDDPAHYSRLADVGWRPPKQAPHDPEFDEYENYARTPHRHEDLWSPEEMAILKQRHAWAPVDHDNSVDLPYDPSPQYPAIPGDTESTIQPIHEIDPEERLSPADSITFEDREESEGNDGKYGPGPSPDNFAKAGGVNWNETKNAPMREHERYDLDPHNWDDAYDMGPGVRQPASSVDRRDPDLGEFEEDYGGDPMPEIAQGRMYQHWMNSPTNMLNAPSAPDDLSHQYGDPPSEYSPHSDFINRTRYEGSAHTATGYGEDFAESPHYLHRQWMEQNPNAYEDESPHYREITKTPAQHEQEFWEQRTPGTHFNGARHQGGPEALAELPAMLEGEGGMAAVGDAGTGFSGEGPATESPSVPGGDNEQVGPHKVDPERQRGAWGIHQRIYEGGLDGDYETLQHRSRGITPIHVAEMHEIEREADLRTRLHEMGVHPGDVEGYPVQSAGEWLAGHPQQYEDCSDWSWMRGECPKGAPINASYREAGLSDKYADIIVDADYHNDPVAQFRHDPHGYINRIGHVEDEGDNLRMAEYAALVDGDMSIREAAWKDVRMKAMRLRREGRVHIKDVGPDRIYASVEGDHGTYDTMIVKGGSFGGLGGGHAVSNWRCSCEWGKWAFKRQFTFVGRLCSHGYASYLEMQSQHVKGQPRLPRQTRLPKRGSEDIAVDPATGPRMGPGNGTTEVGMMPTFDPSSAQHGLQAAGSLRRADALQMEPQRLVPELVVNDTDDVETLRTDVTEDERQTTGPGDIVHFAALQRYCDSAALPYPPELVAHLTHAYEARRKLAEDQDEDDWKIEDAGNEGGRALVEIRDFADRCPEKDLGNMAERVDEVRDAVEEARDAGTDADQLVASRLGFKLAAPGDDDPSKNLPPFFPGGPTSLTPTTQPPTSFPGTPDPGNAQVDVGGAAPSTSPQPGPASPMLPGPDATRTPPPGGQTPSQANPFQEMADEMKNPGGNNNAGPKPGGEGGWGGSQGWSAPGSSSSYTVKPGDTLSDIAQTAYGDSGNYKDIVKNNPNITNPDLITPGEKLNLPGGSALSDSTKGKTWADSGASNSSPAGLGNSISNPAKPPAGTSTGAPASIGKGFGRNSGLSGGQRKRAKRRRQAAPGDTTDPNAMQPTTPNSGTKNPAGATPTTSGSATDMPAQMPNPANPTDPAGTVRKVPSADGPKPGDTDISATGQPTRGTNTGTGSSPSDMGIDIPGLGNMNMGDIGNLVSQGVGIAGDIAGGIGNAVSGLAGILGSHEGAVNQYGFPIVGAEGFLAPQNHEPFAGSGPADPLDIGSSADQVEPWRKDHDDVTDLADTGYGDGNDAYIKRQSRRRLGDHRKQGHAMRGITRHSEQMFFAKDGDQQPQQQQQQAPKPKPQAEEPLNFAADPRNGIVSGPGGVSATDFSASDDEGGTSSTTVKNSHLDPNYDPLGRISMNDYEDPYAGSPHVASGVLADWQNSEAAQSIMARNASAPAGGGGMYDDFSSSPVWQRVPSMQRTAGRNFSLAEQNELIREGDQGGARNLDQLDLTNTHYEAMNSVGLFT